MIKIKLYCYRSNLYNQEYGKKDPLYINNFGFYENISHNIDTHRPQGRADYQLIYVQNGEIKIEDQILKNGEYCIFYPHDLQKYTYLKQDNSCFYWVHFTGNDLHNILKNPSLSSGIHSSTNRKNEVDALFALLMQSAIHEKNCNSPYACALLTAIFHLLSSPATKSPFMRAKKHLEDITSHKSISELAELYHMTSEHFIRSFKLAHGVTPANYRISHQLLQAKILLADTQLAIFTVAEMCGFSDPYYFSRLFKKHTGTSPTEYRKQFSDLI